MIRTFIAVPIPIITSVAACLTNLKSKLVNDKIKWIDPANMHITLFFMGDTEEEKIAEIETYLQDAFFDFTSFEIELSELGLFSRQGRPQVIWMGIKRIKELTEIKKSIDNKLSQIGFQPEDRPFKPHLTLGRVKYVSDKKQLNDLVQRDKMKVYGRVKINEIILYKSELTSAGPIYTPLETVQLV